MRDNKNKKQSDLCCKIKAETDTLFRFAPPRQLRKSVTEIYSIYLQNIDHMDFKEVALDIYFLK